MPTPRPVTIIGSYLSPYVRKVLVCLETKGIEYRVDPIVPFFGNEEFTRLSPLRRIPVLIDDEVVVPDSTAICEYLEERVPSPALLPKRPADRARSRWLEEYADTRMGDVFIWRLFDQLVIRRFVWGEKPDEAIVHKALEEDIPEVLDDLEREVPAAGFLFGALGIADIAIATFLRNAAFARYAIDPAGWPRTASFVERVLAQPGFARLRPYEEVSLRTPIQHVRGALLEAGAPISGETFATDVPRRGVARG